MSPRDAAMPSPRTRVGYTPNFDGVLNNGDSWVARRRASEASLKSGAGTSRDPGDQPQDGKAPEIREEEEDINLEPRRENGEVKSAVPEPDIVSGGNSQTVNDGAVFQDNPNLGAAMSQSSHTYNQPIQEPLSGTRPPPGIPDLPNIEWSYKDPSGQIQGTNAFTYKYQGCY
jgi:PERQ amino acid-rich with GYF domain-containing protein